MFDKKLSDPGVLLENTWSIYKSRFWTFVGILLAPTLIVILVIAALIGGFLNLKSLELALWETIFFIFLGVLLLFIVLLAQIWGQISLVYAIKDKKGKIGIIEAYKRAWPKILSYLWISILVGLITSAGFILLIVPGIIFMVWFGFASFILVVEGIKGRSALLKSKEYVKGRWWPVFGRILFISIIVGITGSLVGSIAGQIFKLIDISWLENIGSSIVSIFIIPFSVIYSFLIYKNLKLLKRKLPFTLIKK